MNIEIVDYKSTFDQDWDTWCGKAENSTFLHTRRFLSYHQNRYFDKSILLFDDGKLVGVMPAALHSLDVKTVVSHPGITYGGLVIDRNLRGERCVNAFDSIRRYYLNQGYKRLIYKPLPYIYANVPAQDDIYALFRLNASRSVTNLSSTINLKNRRALSTRRRRSLKKTVGVVDVCKDVKNLEELWEVLIKNLNKRYRAAPVHSCDEIRLLMARFPKNINLYCGMINGKIEAGVVIFNTKTVWHTQYICSSELGHKLSVLDAVFERVIVDAEKARIQYFDFGTSNEDQGRFLNDGLYKFKTEFGGGGVAYESYELIL